MGGANTKERLERARKSSVLNLSECDIKDWDDMSALLRDLKAPISSCDLGRNRLPGPVPSALLALPLMTRLKVLDLSDNRLTSVGALTLLHDAGTAEGGPSEAVVGRALARLHVMAPAARDALAAGGGAQRGGNSNSPLEVLNLSGNRLEALPPGIFLAFPRLRKLLLSRNRIVLPSAAAVGRAMAAAADVGRAMAAAADVPQGTSPYAGYWLGAAALEELDLADNNVTVIDALFADAAASGSCLPKLQTVCLARNSIAAVDFSFAGHAFEGGVIEGSTGEDGGPSTAAATAATPLKTCTKGPHSADHGPEISFVPAALPALRLLDISHQGHREKEAGRVLERVDARLYTLCPLLNRLDLDGNANAPVIIDRLKQEEAFVAWEKRNAATVSKQISGGTEVRLMT